MVVKDLRTLKYYELQKLAKVAGIRANQKIDKLIKALEEHYMESGDDALQEKKVCQALTSGAVKKLGTPGLEQSTVRSVSNALRKSGTPGFQQSTKASNLGAVRKSGTPSLNQSKKTPVSVGSRMSGTPQLQHSTKASILNAMKKSSTPVLHQSTKASVSGTVSKSGTTNLHQSIKVPIPDKLRKSGTPQLQQSTLKSADIPGSSKQPKKRRRTFELEEPTLSAANTPTSDAPAEKRTTRSSSRTNTPIENGPEAKRQRRNTFDKTDSLTEVSNVSPGTTDMIASMDANQDSAERKANLLSAINKKIQNKVSASPMKSGSQPSQIPRFMAYLASMRKEKEQAKPVTPGSKDWTKIHKKEFSKFDSLDVYLQKKQERKDLLSGSGKRLNPASSRTTNTKIAKPVAKPQSTVKPFVPSVTSIKNMTFNFGTTPSRHTNTSVAAPKSSTKSGTHVVSNKTLKHVTPATSAPRKSFGSSNRATPFKFTGGNLVTKNAPISASKKSVFDLKASLAKPLSWKPHTGKLQPLDINTSIAVPTQPVAAVVKPRPVTRPSRQAMATKTRATNVKDIRRVQQLDRRNNQKYIDMMRRRGLMA